MHDDVRIDHNNSPQPSLILTGALKMSDVKMTDMKLTDQFAGHEIAGHENAGHEIEGHKSTPIRKMSKITAEWA